MADSMTETPDSENNITEDQVVAWLKTQPDFLNRNPALCDILLPPSEHKGKGVVDFQHYMLKRLRSDRDGVIEEAREIVETSRANMNNQNRVFRAVLMLLEAKQFDDFVHTITMDMASILDVDIIALCIESSGDVIPHINMTGVKAVAPDSIGKLMGDQAIKLNAHIEGHEGIYGGGCGLVKSEALVRLNVSPDSPDILLAFGSRDPNLFEDGQGTELLSFVGLVIERCLRIWLDVS